MSVGGEALDAAVSDVPSRSDDRPDSAVRRSIDGIVSIYGDGLSLLEKIRGRSAESRADPLLRLLEESMDQAVEDIEKEKRRGIMRFGKAFEDGDQVSVITLQQATIQIQSNLLAKLQEAAGYEDEVLDSTSLIDAADMGRDKSMGAQIELRLRLFKATPLNALPMPGFSASRRSQDSPVSVRTISVSSQGGQSTSNSFKSAELEIRQEKPSRDTSRERDASDGAEEGRSQPRRHRHSSILSRLRHHRSGSEVSGHNLDEDDRRPSSKSLHQHSLPKLVQSGIDHMFSSHEESSDGLLDVPGKQDQLYQRRDTFAASSPSLGTADAPQPSIAPATTRHLSTIQSVDTNISRLPTSLQPTPDNDYLGFCKGAARLQTGDRTAMQKTKEFNDGWSQSVVYYLTCSNNKCAFAAHMNIDTVWSKVWDLRQEQGLRFRWAFLAKSHVSMSKVKDGQVDYQCLFCVFLGYQPSVISGTDAYLDHVSQEHRGQPLSEIIRYRTGCVNDRVCEDSEDFDINLLPLTETETSKLRTQSEAFPDESNMTAKVSSDADTITITNDPWNEGLSDFHYLDELEYTHSLRSFRSKG